jgi:hypothetical protein
MRRKRSAVVADRVMGWGGGRSSGGACRRRVGARQWPERPVRVEALADTAVASETLPGTASLTTHQNRPTLEEGVAPAV